MARVISVSWTMRLDCTAYCQKRFHLYYQHYGGIFELAPVTAFIPFRAPAGGQTLPCELVDAIGAVTHP